jgi:X-X-X-Leu-X-X-Gly heptad repeat protein
MRILQLSKKLPFPLHDGEAIAVHALMTALHELGCAITLLVMDTPKHPANVATLPKNYTHYQEIHTITVDTDVKPLDALRNIFTQESYNISRFYNTAFAEKLTELLRCNEYDIIQLETLYLAPYTDIIRQHSRAKIALRAHNVEYEIWERMAENEPLFPKKWYLTLLAKRLKAFEIQKINSYDLVVSITERDLQRYRDLGSNVQNIVAPVGVDLSEQVAVGSVPVGSEQVAVSSEQVAVSSEQVAVGSEQLAGGSEQLAVGSEQLAVGSEQLADSLAQSPITNSQSPITNPQSPITNPQSPITNPQSPITNPQSPISNPQSPIPNPQSPITNPQSPITNLQSPITNLQSPISNPQSLKIGFIGSLDWLPNIEGIEWFLTEIWSEIAAQNPNISLNIAGRNMPKSWLQHRFPNVNMVGEVADAHAFIQQHDVMLIPLLSGGGMRIKAIEAMWLGKTVLTTTIGIEGIDGQHNTHFYIANTKADFAAAFQYLCANPVQITQIGAQAHQFIHTHFDQKAIAKRVLAAYKAC